MAHSKGKILTKVHAGSCLLLALLGVAICEPLQAANDQVHVIDADELTQWWQLAPGYGRPHPPAPDPSQPTPTGCMAVAFEIHADGSVSNERVWRTTLTNALADKQLERGVMKAVHQLRYVPASANKDGAPVYTYLMFTFEVMLQGSELSDAKLAEAKCAMTDFPQEVQAMTQAAAKGN